MLCGKQCTWLFTQLLLIALLPFLIARWPVGLPISVLEAWCLIINVFASWPSRSCDFVFVRPFQIKIYLSLLPVLVPCGERTKPHRSSPYYWASVWQNLQSDMGAQQRHQPGHPPSLIRVFAVYMKKAWVLPTERTVNTLIRLGGYWLDWAFSYLSADKVLC